MSNLTKDQRTALKELKGLKDEMILPADKGNTTVMMRCDYDRKMEEILGTGTYEKLRGDPTATQENRLSRNLRGLNPRVWLPVGLNLLYKALVIAPFLRPAQNPQA